MSFSLRETQYKEIPEILSYTITTDLSILKILEILTILHEIWLPITQLSPKLPSKTQLLPNYPVKPIYSPITQENPIIPKLPIFT